MRQFPKSVQNDNNLPISTPKSDRLSLDLGSQQVSSELDDSGLSPNKQSLMPISEESEPEVQLSKDDKDSSWQSLSLEDKEEEASANLTAPVYVQSRKLSMRTIASRIGLYGLEPKEREGNVQAIEQQGNVQQSAEFKPLMATLPRGLELGTAFANADRLFDAVAQALAHAQIKDQYGKLHTIKSLRQLCFDYLQCHVVFLENEGLIFDPDYIQRLQYTVEEAEDMEIEPVGGNLNYMGRILSTCLNVTFHCVEIFYKSPENDPIHYYIEGQKITAILDDSDKNIYQRANTIHLVIYHSNIGHIGHIVPIVLQIPFADLKNAPPPKKFFPAYKNPVELDASFFDSIIVADEETLGGAKAIDEHYYYSDSDMFVLMLSIRKRYLQYEDQDKKTYEIRGNEPYDSTRQNRSRIYLANPTIPETFKNSLLDDFQLISGAFSSDQGQCVWKNGGSVAMPTLLIFPILINASSRRVGHWCSIRMSISYESREVSMLWSNPFGAKAPFPEEVKEFIKGILIETVKILFRVQTGESGFRITEKLEQLMDQQGFGGNNWDSGPITAQNIEDFMNPNISNQQFGKNQAVLSIQSAKRAGHEKTLKDVRGKHYQDYRQLTSEHPFSARVVNAKLGDINQVLSKRFKSEWDKVETDPESLKIFEAVSAWPVKLVAIFFQKIYLSRGIFEREKPFSLEKLQSTYQEVIAYLEKYLEMNACVMAFQGDDHEAIDKIFKLFSLTKERAIQDLLENLKSVSDILEVALKDTLLKEGLLFIQYLEKSFAKTEQEIIPSLKQYQSQIVGLYGLESLEATEARKITESQIGIFIHAHKEKLLAAFVSFDILEKTHRGGWPHELLLQALAKLQFRKLYFWDRGIRGRLESVEGEFSLLQPRENDLHLSRLDKGKFSILDHAVISEIAAEQSEPVLHLFKFYDPDANSVYLVGTFNNWLEARERKIKPDDAWLMQKDERTGLWELSVKLRPGDYEFNYVIDEENWQMDSMKAYGKGPNNTSLCHIPRPGSHVNLLLRTGPSTTQGLGGRSRASSQEPVQLPTEDQKVQLPPREELEALAFEAVGAGQFEILGLLLGYKVTPTESAVERIETIKKKISPLDESFIEAQNAFHAVNSLDFGLGNIEKAFSVLTNPREEIEKAWKEGEKAGLKSIVTLLNRDPNFTIAEVAKIKEEESTKLIQYLNESKVKVDKAVKEKAPLRIDGPAVSAIMPLQESRMDQSEFQALREEVKAKVESLDQLTKDIPRDKVLMLLELAEYESNLKIIFDRKSEYLMHIKNLREKGFLHEFPILSQISLNGAYSDAENVRRKALARELQISPDAIDKDQRSLLSVAIYAYLNPVHFRLFHGLQFPQDLPKISDPKEGTYFVNITPDGAPLKIYYLNKNKFYKIEMIMEDEQLRATDDLMKIAIKRASKPSEIFKGAGYEFLKSFIFQGHKKRFIKILQLLVQRGAGLENRVSNEAIIFAATHADQKAIEVIKLEMAEQINWLESQARCYQSPLIQQQNSKLLDAKAVIGSYEQLLHINQALPWIIRVVTLVQRNLKARAKSVAILMVDLRIAMATQNALLLAEAASKLFDEVSKEGYRVEGWLYDNMISIINSLKANGMDSGKFQATLEKSRENSPYSLRQASPESADRPEGVRRVGSSAGLFISPARASRDESVSEKREDVPKGTSIINNNNI